MSDAPKNLEIDSELHMRLSMIADQHGKTADELVSEILSEHADTLESDNIERSQLEHRWQNYLDTGETIPAERIQDKLRDYAAEAARRTES
ncbi:MAG: hypothetical protein AAF718_17345 [Pseudomonadota bacterium]